MVFMSKERNNGTDEQSHVFKIETCIRMKMPKEKDWTFNSLWYSQQHSLQFLSKEGTIDRA